MPERSSTKRTYHQYCGLAAALDVVGERWALLVVRDLVPGPRRFKDLFDGLPGIATDVLTERLRSLEVAGAVEQRTLRHPVPAKVYALTERGHQLAAIAADLAGWGMALLPPTPPADMRTNPRWALQTMSRRYRGGLAPGEYRWTIGDEELAVVVTDDPTPRAATVYGHASTTPRLDVQCDPGAFFAAIRHAPARKHLDVRTGNQRLVSSFFAALPLPLQAARA